MKKPIDLMNLFDIIRKYRDYKSFLYLTKRYSIDIENMDSYIKLKKILDGIKDFKTDKDTLLKIKELCDELNVIYYDELEKEGYITITYEDVNMYGKHSTRFRYYTEDNEK